MATKKRKKPRIRRPVFMTDTEAGLSNLTALVTGPVQERIGIVEAKLGSTVLELGKANKRIDNLTTGFTQGLVNAAKPAEVSDKVWHESEILKRWDNHDRTKLIELLIWNL